MQLVLPYKYLFIPPSVDNFNLSIIVIGAGGTGGYFIRDLARYISTGSINGFQLKDVSSLLIVDGDAVEEKNITRQNFIPVDIGRNKAEVMAERYGSAFGIKAGYIPQYYGLSTTGLRDLYGVSYNLLSSSDINIASNNYLLVVSCTDSVAARIDIDKDIQKIIYDLPFLNSVVWVDSGNEEFNGQIVISSVIGVYLNRGSAVTLKFEGETLEHISGELPSMLFWYPELLKEKEKRRSEMSCAELAVSSPQTINVNIMAGMLLFNTVVNLLTNNLTYYKLNFDTLSSVVTKSPITKDIPFKFVPYQTPDPENNVISTVSSETFNLAV